MMEGSRAGGSVSNRAEGDGGFMYHIVLVAALGGSGASIGWHEHQPYGTCGVTYECGCYGSGPAGASPCPACGGRGQSPGYGAPGLGTLGGPGPGYVPDY